MSQVSVRVDIRGFKGWIDQEPERTRIFEQKYRIEGGALVAYEMALHTPRRTGRLVGSIVREDTPEGFKVYPKAEYARWVEEGTGIFGPRFLPIFPRRAKALRFEVEGKTIFARYVKGQRGQFFVKRTREIVGPKLFDLMKKIWRKLHGKS